MSKTNKFFRVAVEGATCDGREVSGHYLREIAANYNPALYGARVNLEHCKSLPPNTEFRCYGDVLAVKLEEITSGPLRGKLALYAQIAPTPALLALNASGQKVYSSIEIDPNFAGSGKAYLKGLAVTDTPASLGTELLKFSELRPECCFSALLETDFPGDISAESRMTTAFKSLLFGADKKPLADTQEVRDVNAALAQFTAQQTHQQTAVLQEMVEIKQQLTALTQALRGTPNNEAACYSARPVALGSAPRDNDDITC